VIPVFRRTPRWWDRLPGVETSAREIVAGYLSAFEPDFVVATRPGQESAISVEEGRVIQIEDVLSEGEDNGVRYGTSAVEVYQRLYDDRFRFVQRRPPTVVVPSAGKSRLDLFLAGSLGTFPQSPKLQYFERAYPNAFDAS